MSFNALNVIFTLSHYSFTIITHTTRATSVSQMWNEKNCNPRVATLSILSGI